MGPSNPEGPVGPVQPGTGLGGAVLQIGESKDDIIVETDGHIYDVMISGNYGDDGDAWMAEDIISGRAVYEKCDVSAKEINDCDDKWSNHELYVTKIGDAIAQLINTLISGSFQKKHLSNEWSYEDKENMKSVDIILLGGGLTKKGRFGNHIYNVVKQKINLPLHQINKSNEAALIGLAHTKKIFK